MPPTTCSQGATAPKFARDASRAMNAIQPKKPTMNAETNTRSQGFCSRWMGDAIRSPRSFLHGPEGVLVALAEQLR